MADFARKSSNQLAANSASTATAAINSGKQGSSDELTLPKEVERMSFLSFDEVQPRIKDVHQKYQTDIVTDLSKISQ